LTPGPHVPPAFALIWRAALAVILVLVITNLLRRHKYLASPGREILCSAVAVFVLQTVVLLFLHKYWTAGKALSYFALPLLLVAFSPLLTANSGSSLPRGWTGAACSVLLLAQGFMLLYRPIAAYKRPLRHYRQPYPASLDQRIKRRFDFSNWTVLNEIGAQDAVRIEVEDPWLQYFVQMLLLSHNRRFCVATPVEEDGVPLVASPCQMSSGDFSGRLCLAGVRDPPIRQYLKFEPIHSN
jgi:hypothetical protein